MTIETSLTPIQLMHLDFLKNANKMKNFKGGKKRGEKGEYIEGLAQTIIYYAWELLKQPKSRLVVNNIKIPYYKGSHSKIGLDLFVYVDKNLVGLGESKAYCDFSMFKRAYDDFSSVYTLFPKKDLFYFIFQIEAGMTNLEKHTINGVQYNYLEKSQALYDYLTFKRNNFNLNFDIDFITLTPRKRVSSKEYTKNIQYIEEARIKLSIEYFYNLLKKYAIVSSPV